MSGYTPRIWLDRLASPNLCVYKGYIKPPREFKNLNDALEFLIEQGVNKFRSHPTLNVELLRLRGETLKDEKRLILEIFKKPYSSSILRALSEVNMLGQIIPPLKKVEAWPQFDGYHRFPVDLHLIASVEALEEIKDRRIKEVYDALEPKYKVLIKLVTLLHDAGKGRVSDHHKVGAKIFKAYAKRIDLDETLLTYRC